MSNFRTRMLGLAALATAFVGVSFGQNVSCTSNQAGTVDGAATNATGITTNVTQINTALRVEGQTEQLSLLQFGCTGSSNTGGSLTTGGTITFTTNLPITSKATSSTTNEATLIVNGVVGPGGVVTLGASGFAIPGTVSGNTVTFTIPTAGTGSIATPLSPATATTYFELTNIRVNASTAPATPYQSTEGGLLAYVTSTTSGTTTAFTAIAATNNSGLVVPSLGPPKITVNNSYTTCVGNTGSSISQSFTLSITQLISGAFLGTGAPPVGELGQYAATEGSPTVSADTINVTLSGLPSGGTVYVPKSVTATDPNNPGPPGGNYTTLTITGAATSTATGIPSGTYTAFSVSSTGTVAIPYTVSAVNGNGAPANTPYLVGVYVGFAANSVSTPTTITGNYSYSPTAATLTGPSASIPVFVASNFTPASGTAISLCQTTLLFPFVTNQVGFDTGIAIANTSQDNLGTAGASKATPQAGICQLYFYGPTAPTPPTGSLSIPDPMGSLAGGNTHAFQLSSVAVGYQGYMIAVCPFNYAHAFAFLTYGITTSNGIAEGYLAEVLGNGTGTDRGQSTATGDNNIQF